MAVRRARNTYKFHRVPVDSVYNEDIQHATPDPETLSGCTGPRSHHDIQHIWMSDDDLSSEPHTWCCCCCLEITSFIFLSILHKVTFSHTRYRVLGSALIPVYRQSASDLLTHPPAIGITFRETYGHLPSRRTSPSFDQYQVILLGDRGT